MAKFTPRQLNNGKLSGKSKAKVRPTTGHEDPEGEYSSGLSKSPAEDQIHAEFFKHAGKEAKASICMWFQKIWETGMVRPLWEKAVVVLY